MKILVLGASGMAGHVIALYFRERDYKVDTISLKRKLFDDSMLLDIHKTDQLIKTVLRGDYDILVNGVGLLVQESEQRPEEAIFINAYLPRWLENQLSGTKTKIIHISSDAVFSGKLKQYTESSTCDAQSTYGRSKALGEINNSKDLTIRTSIIGPQLDYSKNSSLFGWLMNESGTINGFTNNDWCGITTLELAKIIEYSISNQISGIVHVTPKESISKFQLLLLINMIFEKKDLYIKPTLSGTQSNNSNLVSERTDFTYDVKDFKQMLQELHVWVGNHPQYYQKYKTNT